MKETNCIICNKNAQLTRADLQGYQEGEIFNIYHCSACDTAFASPHEVSHHIYHYIYSQAEIVPGYNRYTVYAKEIVGRKNPLAYLAGKEAMYYAVKEILGDQKDSTINILEVGSGLGYLTYAIAKEGYNITGLDISPEAISRAKRQFGDHYICGDVYTYATANAGKFDIIILTEVIEHVQTPLAFCKALVSLLTTNGKLIITTPNKSAYPQHENWNTELPPVHLSWFSENSFRELAKNNGLCYSFFDFSNFNKQHADITKTSLYETYTINNKRVATLDKEGRVLLPKNLAVNNATNRSKALFRKLVKPLLEFFIVHFFTSKKNPARNNILCVILQKR